MDFDGDALNLTLMVDQKLAYLMETFAPFYNSKQLDNVGRVSGNIYISKSLVGAYWRDYITNIINDFSI